VWYFFVFLVDFGIVPTVWYFFVFLKISHCRNNSKIY
jgi:hypothetical protein